MPSVEHRIKKMGDFKYRTTNMVDKLYIKKIEVLNVL